LFFYVIGKGSMTICSTSWSMSDSNYSTPHTIYLYPISFVNNILTFIIDHVSDINSVSRTHQIVQITGDWRTIGINIPYLTGDNNTGENVPQNGLPGLRIIDNRFIVAYICDLEINDLISHSPVMLGGKNDDILLIDANNSDTPLSQIKWCSKYLTIVIMETNYGGSDSPMIYIKALLPASSNSFYVILDVVPNHYKLYKVTGPFEPAASVPDFTVHN
ncbi:MAG TPA: hypothetical protein PK360_19255, partial [bacterium]|nr:hypothetical protein [bacterium]